MSADARSADLPSICGLSMSADVLPLLADARSADLLPVGAPLGSQVVPCVDLPATRVCSVPTTAPPLGRRCRCHGTCGLVTHLWAPDVCACSSRLRHKPCACGRWLAGPSPLAAATAIPCNSSAPFRSVAVALRPQESDSKGRSDGGPGSAPPGRNSAGERGGQRGQRGREGERGGEGEHGAR